MLDLYLGSDLGLWALEQVPRSEVLQVFTLEKKIADQANDLGIKCYLENANEVEFIPSKTAFSIHYPKIIKPHLITKYQKMYNLHPAYLPWGKGYYPIFWSLWENTPAGATLHEINEGIDQGKIVDQLLVEYFDYDTGGSLFNRVRDAEKKLLLKYWHKISKAIDLPAYTQTQGGTYHTKKEFFELKKQANWSQMQGKDLVKLIRCLTFDSYTGLELELGERKFELSLNLISNE